MKKYLIHYETDFCDDFPETMGEVVFEANSEAEAIEKFNKNKPFHSFITEIKEI